MNRFEDGVELPKKHCRPWDNRANVVDSKGNHCMHTQYKQFFDKRKGEQQYRDTLKYIYKTPSCGIRDYSFYDKTVKYFFEFREPVHPGSP
jgi:hypothetical protein